VNTSQSAGGTAWRWLWRAVALALPVVLANACWRMDTVVHLATGPLAFTVALAPSEWPLRAFAETRAEIWLWRAAVAAGLASAWRLTYLPHGHLGVSDLVVPAIALAMSIGFSRARLHDRRQRLSKPLNFPLTGTWYVARGSERRHDPYAAMLELRGAIDLVKIGPDGRRVRRGASPADYPAYGSPVYAPCDGVVTGAADGLPDTPLGRPGDGPPEGNHLWIDTGHETVLLAHLRPGSLHAAVGDHVRSGQLLAEVGTSGTSDEPHLHLHAERDDRGLDLRFAEVGRRGLWRGRRITVAPRAAE
jgi:hypothetical protein